MADAGLGRLGEAGLQPLDHKQDQHLPGQSRAVLQSEQNQLESLLLHGCMTNPQRNVSNRGPHVTQYQSEMDNYSDVGTN